MRNFWEINGWESQDRHLKLLDSMPFRRNFPFLPEAPGLYIIRGPRQIGKSSWLKSILSLRVKDKKKCFYLSCENVSDYKELSEILSSLRGYDAVLLDEVNFVEGWDRAIKYAIDSGYTNVLVITGSHQYDLIKGADRMPGRFDAGGEFLLLPMSFEEFCDARRQAGWNLASRLEELKSYFKVGGFPLAVAEAGPESKKPIQAIKTYARWLLGDVVRLGKQEGTAKDILNQLALILQTPVSLQTLAKKTGVGSHNTVQEYLSIFDSCFALRTLRPINLDTGTFYPKKDRKFYFTDPLVYWAALGFSEEKTPKNFESLMAEMVAHEALARLDKRFGFFGSASGEIDFISPKKWAIEVKWGPIPTNLSKAYKNLQMLNKRVWTYENFLKDLPEKV